MTYLTRHITNTHKDGPDFVILKADLKNAFNLVSRQRLLEIIIEEFPEVARWAHWCYGGAEGTNLWFNNWTLDSLEGVQQGDPLGPLFFSVVIQRIIRLISIQCPDLSYTNGT